MSASRQLAAIMFTDIVGYTALMGDDEQKAFHLLHQNRQLQKPLIKQFRGEWVKELGDGVLASFHTGTDAVMCAVAIQQASQSKPGLQLRIGIHLGEVVFENNDVFGDSVNIASRLQALAPVGGIWISEAVQKNISNKKEIHTEFVRFETLKNVKGQVAVYEILMAGPDPVNQEISTATETAKTGTGNLQAPRKSVFTRKRRIALIVSLLIAVLPSSLLLRQWLQKQRARTEIIPQIRQLAAASFFPSSKAFDLANEAEKYIPEDSALQELWSKVAWRMELKTNPEGADFYWKDYNDLSDNWKLIGKTPLNGNKVPTGFYRVKIEKKGFATIYSPNFFWGPQKLDLDSTGKIPDNMVRVYGSETPLMIVGLEQYEGRYVCDFLIDKYEVTNKEYKQFIDAGGYKTTKYWDYPVFSSQKEIPWQEAIDLFHDKTGRPGPASWEVGNFPDGKENNPVTGISWYEAMAYAKYAGKKLPTVYQWSQVANTWNTWEIIPRSNFNGTGTMAAGSKDAISFWGVQDIAGNAREWCLNESGQKHNRYILGGGFDDPSYAFNDGSEQPAIDRSPSNGFRCIKLLPGDTTYDKLTGMVDFAFRDYKTETAVSKETFGIFLRQYSYDPLPLNANVTQLLDSSLYRIEKIEMDAAYNKERLTAYLMLPKNSKPPYQTIIYYPGSNILNVRKFDLRSELLWMDYILKSGRAFCLPVLKGTYERGDDIRSDLQNETANYKEHVIYWVKDIKRSLDYLDTRNDIMHDKYGYFGMSWGSAMGPVVCGVEKRFKAAVFHVGGLMMQKTFPEVDPINYLPQVQIPVLMLNGKNDTFYPLETSQKPMFERIGVPESDKKIIFYEGGHLVPRLDLIKESLGWFDKYLGEKK